MDSAGNQIERIDVEDYPAIKNHLDSHWERIEKRYDQGDTPYNLRHCAYMEDFDRQKIIFQEMVQEPSFTFDNEGVFFCLDTARIIVGEKLKILLAIMNSKLFFYSVKKFYGGGGLGGSGVRMKHTFFENFPAPDFKTEEIKKIEELLENPKINDKKIEEIIQAYYNFTIDEIRFIDLQ